VRSEVRTIRVPGETLTTEHETCLKNCSARFQELHERAVKRYKLNFQIKLLQMSPSARQLLKEERDQQLAERATRKSHPA